VTLLLGGRVSVDDVTVKLTREMVAPLAPGVLADAATVIDGILASVRLVTPARTPAHTNVGTDIVDTFGSHSVELAATVKLEHTDVSGLANEHSSGSAGCIVYASLVVDTA
jgi:hypothetical protein